MRLVFALIALACAGGCASGMCDSCPTVSLTANGETDLVVDVGTEITYAWSSSNADTASSTVTLDSSPDACGNANGAWVVTTLAGSLDPTPILPCQAGVTYTLELEVVHTASDEHETASLVIAVR